LTWVVSRLGFCVPRSWCPPSGSSASQPYPALRTASRHARAHVRSDTPASAAIRRVAPCWCGAVVATSTCESHGGRSYKRQPPHWHEQAGPGPSATAFTGTHTRAGLTHDEGHVEGVEGGGLVGEVGVDNGRGKDHIHQVLPLLLERQDQRRGAVLLCTFTHMQTTESARQQVIAQAEVDRAAPLREGHSSPHRTQQGPLSCGSTSSSSS
jgi:hypothetical protein